MIVKKLAENNQVERIREHYLNGFELNEHDVKVRGRLETAHAMYISDRASDKAIVNTLVKRFGIDQSTAHSDIKNCKAIFGDTRKATKDGLRYAVTQWAIDLFRVSEIRHDTNGMASALERITKVNNLDKEDMDMPDPAKIQPPVQLLSISFNILDSPRFHMMDDSAQAALIEMYDNVMAQIVNTPMKDYLDVFVVKNPRVKTIKLPDAD